MELKSALDWAADSIAEMFPEFERHPEFEIPGTSASFRHRTVQIIYLDVELVEDSLVAGIVSRLRPVIVPSDMDYSPLVGHTLVGCYESIPGKKELRERLEYFRNLWVEMVLNLSKLSCQPVKCYNCNQKFSPTYVETVDLNSKCPECDHWNTVSVRTGSCVE